MAQHRNFEIETTIVPDAAGQFEAAFVVREIHGKGVEDGKAAGENPAPGTHMSRYEFPPVGSYLTPDDAREQTEAWARKWIDANFARAE
jgi:hypothetical protein